jgi:hypothetical protein
LQCLDSTGGCPGDDHVMVAHRAFSLIFEWLVRPGSSRHGEVLDDASGS